MNRYPVLIVGAGNKGALADACGTGNHRKFISYAHAVRDHPGFELSCITDRDPCKERAAEKIWNPTHTSHSLAGLKGLRFDVAIVATNDETHYDVLKQLTRQEYHGLKLVICEKPLCTEIEQAREIVELYKQKNIPILCDYTRRFIPQWRTHKEAIDRGDYGKFICAYGRFNDSYSDDAPIEDKRRRAFLHSGSHMIDTALWMCGEQEFDFRYIPSHYKWLYQWCLCFEKSHVGELMGDFTKENVPSIYDKHLWYVMENAYGFLEGMEPLLCTGEQALISLEETYRFIQRG